jgi:hypothetical protein
VLYRNRDGWGLADAPAHSLAPGLLRLDFDWAAVPPLVDLTGVWTPGLDQPASAPD